MRLGGRRSKLALHLTLWALAGLALLTLPALLSPSPSRTTDTNTLLLGKGSTPATSTSLSNQQPISPPLSQESPGSEDFLLRLSLILIPAALFSTFVKVWSDRRFRDSRA